ncbi:MAG: chemotaxis protein CheW [Nitrospiraceae bacterium]|nr:chemotaxis protein CheW [Nitrospiraceae bacterium]
MSLRGRQVAISSTLLRRFVIVTVGGVRFAMQADYVKGLLRPEEAGSLGDLTVHGQTYVAADVATGLRLSVNADGPDSRIILFAKGEHRISLPVARVHGLIDIEESQVLSLPRHFRSEERRWYQGMVLFEDGVALVLNPDWLIEGCVAHPAMEAAADARRETPLPLHPAMAGKPL